MLCYRAASETRGAILDIEISIDSQENARGRFNFQKLLLSHANLIHVVTTGSVLSLGKNSSVDVAGRSPGRLVKMVIVKDLFVIIMHNLRHIQLS